MARPFGNCAYRYRNPRGKFVFAPSANGRIVGRELKAKIEKRFEPAAHFYHLRDGGHVAALHVHREKRYFARLDLENFFYSIARNRVAHALQALGMKRGEYYARWSSVKNPYAGPSYSLPYGFVQSPLLATLILDQSAVGKLLLELGDKVVVSVYVDDIAISSNNRRVLERAYRKLRKKIIESHFTINEAKSSAVMGDIELFNCELSRQHTEVLEDRKAEFHNRERSAASAAAFDRYCAAVIEGNEI